MDNFDPVKRDALVAKLNERGWDFSPICMTAEELEAEVKLLTSGQALKNREPDPMRAVSLEDFFEGNYEEVTIGGGLYDAPGAQEFYRVLKDIRARDDVQDVLVEISDVSESYWPGSELVWVLTSATCEEVEEWLKPLNPQYVTEPYPGKGPKDAPPLLPGVKCYTGWWD